MFTRWSRVTQQRVTSQGIWWNITIKCWIKKRDLRKKPVRAENIHALWTVTGIGPLVYQADVIEPNRTMQYIGMTGRTFKKRYTEHRGALRNRKTAKRNPIKLSKHVWSLKDRNIQPEMQWKVRAKTGIYFPGAKFCDTCITEKLFILEADKRTCLNQRTEILTKCIHKRKHSLHSTILLPRKRRKKRKKD